MIGDVVGDPGLEALETLLPGLIRELDADFAVVNGENAAGGFGMTEEALERIAAAGADVVTSGNHVWEKREFFPALDRDSRILRPANYPAGCAGRGWGFVEKRGIRWLVVNLQGRDLMQAVDCPFRAFDRIWEESGGGVTLVDFHAETTREKECLGYYVDGRASLIAGTHTHILTADERVLPQGTGYITDLGMTGAQGSIIGMDTKACVERARTQVLWRTPCAQGSGAVQGVAADIHRESGRAEAVFRIHRRA
jgi:metallophosphoesterase (TIGR00282 family)